MVGEISIFWNALEMRLNALIYHYLTVDAPVAGFILGEMGNATKAEFARFLIDHYEPNVILRDHGFHAVNLINRLRENRNILEHARPWDYQDKYLGIIFKPDKRGGLIEFGAPIGELKALLATMKNSVPYLRWHTFCLHMVSDKEYDGIKGGPTTAEAALRVLSSIDRPQLPDKIAPLQPVRVPKGG